jgi:hypothetical protein
LIKDGIDGTPDKRKPNEYPSIRLWHYSQKYNHKYHMQEVWSKKKIYKEKVDGIAGDDSYTITKISLPRC